MPNGTGNFRSFQISRKKDNLERWTKIFETIFRKLSVPFDFEPEFPEILVEWNAPFNSDDVFISSPAVQIYNISYIHLNSETICILCSLGMFLNFTEINDGYMFSVMSLFCSKTSYRKRLKDTYYCYLWCMHSKRISSFSLRRIMECQAVFCLSYKRFDLFQIVSVSECCVREDKSQLWISHSLKGNWKTKNNANTKKSSQPFMNISKTRIKTEW